MGLCQSLWKYCRSPIRLWVLLFLQKVSWIAKTVRFSSQLRKWIFKRSVTGRSQKALLTSNSQYRLCEIFVYKRCWLEISLKMSHSGFNNNTMYQISYYEEPLAVEFVEWSESWFKSPSSETITEFSDCWYVFWQISGSESVAHVVQWNHFCGIFFQSEISNGDCWYKRALCTKGLPHSSHRTSLKTDCRKPDNFLWLKEF